MADAPAMQILVFLRALLIPQTHLALENLALRQQVAVLKRSVPRPRVQRRDRIFWVLLRRFWPEWRDSLALVKPATVVAWHRQGWRLLWRLKSRGKSGLWVPKTPSRSSPEQILPAM